MTEMCLLMVEMIYVCHIWSIYAVAVVIWYTYTGNYRNALVTHQKEGGGRGTRVPWEVCEK